MYRFWNQSCYCNCYCNWKIFHFGRMLQFLCSHWPPHWWIEFPFDVNVPQVCLHHCESRPHWSWYQSLSLRIFLFWEGVLVWKVTIFSAIFSVIVLFISLWEGVSVWKWAMLLVVVLSLLWAWNWSNGTVGRVSSDWWLSLGLTTDRSPPRSWFKSLSALDCDNSNGISESGSSALMVHLGGCDLVLLAGMVLTLLTESPANWVCFLSLMALFSGYRVSAI